MTAGELIARADAARDARDWAAAAALYAEVTTARPDDAGMWVQLGHALREGGRLGEAEAAYARALALDRLNADTHLFFGHTLRAKGERARAVAAYAQAARVEPGFEPAVRELLAMGARDAVPEEVAAAARDWRRVDAAARALTQGLDAVRDWAATAGYSRASWDRFRKDLPIRPPPGPLPLAPEGGLPVLVDARGRAPALLRATLTGLQDQSVRGWRALVLADAATRAHPVGSFAATDDRIRLVEEPPHEPAGPMALVDAGTLLHPEALAWALFAQARTGAAAVFSDEDRGAPHALRGIDYARPRLLGAFDRDFTLRRGPPAFVLATRQALRGATGAEMRRDALLAAETVAHVPRVLATRLEPPVAAAGAPDGPGDRFAEPDPVLAPDPPPRSSDPIAVVIPTRDNPAVLRRAVDSLRARANDPGRLRFVVVDNRNAAPDATALLAELARRPDATVVPMDEPFNWSRANNAGARASDAPLLLFANDDVEMLSPGWDDALAHLLARDDVGGVGARLLYPDLTVQHAGIVFGLGEGAPEHEGRHAPFDDPGPDDRLVSRRSVAAVTGAFLGLRRERFEAVGGFDEARLFIGHNDIDFCLRLRARGWRILYEPAIEALHHEGATRGRNVTRAEVMWDLGEGRDLVARWGAALAEDPGVNPHWTRHARPFDGLREPPIHELLAHIDRSARSDPWTPRPGGG